MNKFSVILIGMGLVILPACLSASNYYWVGGSGNYSDISHWATTSGGSTFQTIPPGNYDDVFFDVNSFSSTGDTVFFDQGYSAAHYFTIAGVLNTPTFSDAAGQLRIDIQGNFSIEPAINWVSSCTLGFSPLAADSSVAIQTNGVYLPNTVELNGSLNDYNLLIGPISCYALSNFSGNFYSQSNNVNCSYAYTQNGGALYLGNSILTSGYIMDFLSNDIIYSDSATFVSPNFNVNIGLSGMHFGTVIAPAISSDQCYYKVANVAGLAGDGNHVELMIHDTVYISSGLFSLGPNIFQKIIALNAASISANCIIDTLIFTAPGVDLGLPDTLILNGEIIMNNSPAMPGMIAEVSGDSCHLLKTGGIICFDFVTFSNVHAGGGAQFFAGYNSIDNGGNSGLLFTGCNTQGGVWPGDANYDLTVNNMDILAIGLANGESGPVRAGASNSWFEQPVAAWSNSFMTGVNMKHADCDGNGIVEPADTAAVTLNYGLQHPASRLLSPVEKPVLSSILVIDVSPDTVGPSTPVHVNVDLALDSIYGIAFSVYYNSALINSNSMIADFSNSWLGIPGLNLIGFSHAEPAAGHIDFALTRTDHTDAFSGTGHLFSFDLVTSDNIPAASSLTMEANDVYGIYLSQTYEVISGSTDSTYVDSTVSVNTPEDYFMQLSSYIQNGMMALTYYSSHEARASLTITDVTGRVLNRKELEGNRGFNRHIQDVSGLAAGIYLVSLDCEFGYRSIKVVKE